MKKGIIIILAILLAFILISFITSYFFVYGGEPEIENFNDVSAAYETIANVAMKYYNESTDKDERICLTIKEDCLLDDSLLEDNIVINLNKEEKQAIKSVDEAFMCLWVTDEYVIFWEDETKYYGLVYSENPLSTIWAMKSDWYESIDYHRIDSDWYEIGAFGR